MKKTILIIIFYYLLSLNSILFSDEKPIRFVALGHLYPMIEDKERLADLFNKINSHNPDYVFILGDSKLNDLKYLNKFKENIKAKLYFSPGNHELKSFRKEYEKNVGYLNKVVTDNNIKFILLNSSDKKENIINYLNENLDSSDSITILLTHHRIWDDTLMSQEGYNHDKSYYFEEIYPFIKGKVNAIFAGNSKRQHFRDLTDDRLSYGKQNVNLMYWLDKIGDINLYSVGMGDGKPKANFVVVDIFNNEIFVKGDYSSVDNYEILPKELIDPEKYRLNMHDTKSVREFVKPRYLIVNKNKLFFSAFFIILIFLILVFKLFRK
jgi:hypothetical protein